MHILSSSRKAHKQYTSLPTSTSSQVPLWIEGNLNHKYVTPKPSAKNPKSYPILASNPTATYAPSNIPMAISLCDPKHKQYFNPKLQRQ